MSHSISLIAYNGCEAGALMSTVDLFLTANNHAGELDNAVANLYQVQIVSMDGRAVRCSNGRHIEVDGDLSQVEEGDIVLFHGHRLADATASDNAIAQWLALIPWLKDKVASFRLLISNWSGSHLLAEADLLKPAEKHPWRLANFFKPAAELATDNLQTGNVVCAAASTAWVDVCLSVVEKLNGRPFASSLARTLTVGYQRGGQAAYISHPLVDVNNSLISRAEEWIQNNLAERFSVEDLAEHLAVSTRTLIRRFQDCMGQSPQSYIQQTRIERCKMLLETTSLRFSQIVARCGYTDESAFRRLFKRSYNLSPREYRRRLHEE